MQRPLRVLVVGSGLAGLSCAERLLRHGALVTVLTPGYLGRDGATQRVHALAPWIVLNAPCQRGDNPERFFEDLQRAGEGLGRPGLGEVFAQEAPAAAKELQKLLYLRPLDDRATMLPGNSFPRARRFQPGNSHLLLSPLLGPVASLAEIHERAVAVGLDFQGERVCGVWAFHRARGELQLHSADAVVLACGGVGAVFGPSTVPRWCRGSGLALASLAQALLHNPHITQALPVLALPPVYFPTTSALLNARVNVEQELLPPVSNLETLTHLLALALRQGKQAWVELRDEDRELMPLWVQELTRRRRGRLTLTVRVHHGVGGVAIDTWGRTSVPGLYACGEAAGGVQGAKRLLGTGLLEARVFGVRAAHAVIHDLPRMGPPKAGESFSRLLPPPFDADRLEAQIDTWLGDLAVIRPKDEVANRLAALRAWPTGSFATTAGQWQAAIRHQAALLILSGELGTGAWARGEATYELPGRKNVGA